MAGNWDAGDLDELGPIASSSQLDRLGLTPEQVRANPEVLNAALKSATAAGSRSQGTGDSAAQAQAPPAATPKPAKPTPAAPVPPASTGSANSQTAPTPPMTPFVQTPVPGQQADSGQAPASPTTPETAEGYGMAGLGLLKKNLEGATQAAEDVPTTAPPDLSRLTAQRAKLATPAPTHDSQTGKWLDKTQEYDPETGQMVDVNPKPSIKSRIWRGIRGGLEGLLEGGIRGGLLGAIDPKLVTGEAYGAPSREYQRAEERRGQQLEGTDAGIKDTFQTWKDAVDASKAKAGELRANAQLGAHLTSGAVEEQKIPIEQQKADNEDPETKNAATLALDQGKFDLRRQQLASDPRLKGLSLPNQIAYILNGKEFDPQRPTEGEITAAAAARALVIFKAQHGGRGPQTLEDFNEIQQAARGELGGGGKGKQTGGGPTEAQQIAANEKKATRIQQAMNAYAKNPYGKEARTSYEAALQNAENAFAADLGGQPMKVTVDPIGQVTWTPAAPADAGGAVVPPPGATGEILDPQGNVAGHVVNGQPVWIKKTGK